MVTTNHIFKRHKSEFIFPIFHLMFYSTVCACLVRISGLLLATRPRIGRGCKKEPSP